MQPGRNREQATEQEGKSKEEGVGRREKASESESIGDNATAPQREDAMNRREQDSADTHVAAGECKGEMEGY